VGRARSKLRVIAFVTLGLTATLALSGWSVRTYWPGNLPRAEAGLPAANLSGGRIAVRTPGSVLIGTLARYNDEIFAYLMFDYLRWQPAFRDSELFLTYSRSGGGIAYRIQILLPDDLIAGVPRMYSASEDYPFLTPDWFFADRRLLASMRSQTQTFIAAYSFPAYQKLEHLTREEVIAYTRRFIRFKSNTDGRVLRRIEPAPHVLTQDEAQRLAEDIVAVSEFYDLPLDFFLGIGAMENNYMDVTGDIGHAVWKRRAEKGDVILQRRRGRVLVLDEASGVWQITRETLRYAHRLYLKDQRDYTQLPERLRPPQQLDLAALDPEVLTTYAALLFRNLLDRFDGDVAKAVGAYNGGPGNPNPAYEAGVRQVAEYARHVLEQAATLRSQQIGSP
jgi:Transglycosylase SLT domain